MDIKDLIKWLVLCYKIFVILNIACVKADFVSEVTDNLNAITVTVESWTRSVGDFNRENVGVLSDYFPVNNVSYGYEREVDSDPSPRTFGRPMKKLQQALIPLAFQVGVASTWMVLSTVLSAKAVLIGVAILKLLLIAGAVKVGTLFAHHKAAAPAWVPQKEVHLHIHGAQHEATHSHSYEEVHGHSPWSRDGTAENVVISSPTVFTPSRLYSPAKLGPDTINTPYGSYIRIGPPSPIGGAERKRRAVLKIL